MLENVTEGDLAIFKNGEERRINYISRDYNNVSLGFDNPVSCKTNDLDPFNLSGHWSYKYNGEWNGDINDKNDIVKVVNIEEG